ncbi:MAG TPA: VWA domain-containing protein [Armatimonadetes bacterium]|nr:VWA domain-containing protein [Armatimonadota bacterium]
MDFARPFNLLALLLVPAGVYLWWHRQRWEREARRRFAASFLWAQMGERPSFWPARLRPMFLLMAATLLVVAAARPQGEPILTEAVGEGLDLMLLIDVSTSMLATDTPKGNRLEMAKTLVEQLLSRLEADRVGITVFAGNAYVLCPFTLDYNAVLTFLQDLEPQSVREPGTRLGDAVRLAVKRFPEPAPDEHGRALVLLTDGEDHGSYPLAAAKLVQQRKIRLYALGLGSAEGSRILVGMDFWGNPVYKKYRGQEVITRLNETVLKQMAALTEGAYIPARTPQAVDLLLRELNKLQRRAVRSRAAARRRELFPVFVLAALMLLALDTALPLCRRRRH